MPDAVSIPRVKVCGLTHADDVHVAVEAGAGALGFVLEYEASARSLDAEEAARLTALVPSDRWTVAVMVNADPERALATCRRAGARALQLCGDERPADWSRFPLPILRRLAVDADAPGELEAWLPVAAAFVLDHPSGPGGTGQGVNLELAARLTSVAPCFLAGGLDPDNVADRVQQVRPHGVDAASQLEESPGRKRSSLVHAFVGNATRALEEQVESIDRFAASTRFGEFGGTFAPETLMSQLFELESAWLELREEPEFRAELAGYLRDYAGRPTAVTHARRLSDELGFELWLKREDLLHTGAHKLNNTLGQCLLARRMGKRRILAETGAGQHGVATATVCALLGLECVVYMGAVDAMRQRPNLLRMELLGAEVRLVESGARTLKDAINAALRDWVGDPLHTHYVLGSALGPHPFPSIVADFQEVIGQEARAQIMESAGGLPDVAVACVGGGSNAIGLFRGFVSDESVELVGVEAGGTGFALGEHAARFEGGRPGVLHGCFTWLLQDDDGQIAPTTSISAGLDYPAVGPEHADLRARGRARYVRAGDEEALQAFQALAQHEGILPALESSHALAWAIQNKAELAGRRVLVNLSGRGDKDLDTVADLLRQRGGGL